MSHSITSYWFSPFELRVEQGVLLRGEERIPLSPQLFDLLLILVVNQGNIVSKEKLIDKFWLGDKAEKLILDSRLHRLVSELKKKLECGRELIETKSKRGYRFIEPVRKDSIQADEPNSKITFKGESLLYIQLIEQINRTADLLPKGASNLSWIIGREILESWLESWEAMIREFKSKGILLDRFPRRACNAALLEAAKSVAIVESKCFNYKEEWSQYWPIWLEDISKRTDITAKEYYALVTRPMPTQQDVDNLRATEKFLRPLGFSFSICDKKLLVDALGNDLPKFHSLNIFGQFILQINIPSKGEHEEGLAFTGGHELQVWLHDTKSETIYSEFCKLIRENSEKVTSDLIETLQKEIKN